MAMHLCDFRTTGGDKPVRLDASNVAPLVHLRAGPKDNFVTLDVAEAQVLRDALDRFIDAASVLAPHAEAYAARLTNPSTGAPA